MSILINSQTRVIVQGITGHHGSFHARLMSEYGTKIVAGVTPGKAGEMVSGANGSGIPVFDNVADALNFAPADFSILFVPAAHAKEAATEALENNLSLVIITEMIPVHDAMEIIKEAQKKKLHVIGPNCPGVITPGECKIGIMPGDIFTKGRIGVVSRSGTLTYEIVKNLSSHGLGQSTVVGAGGDMLEGLNFVDALTMFENDDETDAVVLIGEIGGEAEENAAKLIQENNFGKPVVAYVAGMTAPKEKRMGHAGAIIMGEKGTFENKKKALVKAGVVAADFPHEIPLLLEKKLRV